MHTLAPPRVTRPCLIRTALLAGQRRGRDWDQVRDKWLSTSLPLYEETTVNRPNLEGLLKAVVALLMKWWLLRLENGAIQHLVRIKYYPRVNHYTGDWQKSETLAWDVEQIPHINHLPYQNSAWLNYGRYQGRAWSGEPPSWTRPWSPNDTSQFTHKAHCFQ